MLRINSIPLVVKPDPNAGCGFICQNDTSFPKESQFSNQALAARAYGVHQVKSCSMHLKPKPPLVESFVWGDTFKRLCAMPRKIVLCMLSIFAMLSASAVSDVKVFTISGNVFELDLTDSTEKGVVKIPIEIWSGDQKITTIMTGPKGKYKVDLAYYPAYTLKFGTAPYITKVIEISTDGIHRAAEFGIVNLDLDITLFKNENYLGLDFMNYTPVAKAAFNKKKGELVWDYAYGDAMNSRVRGVIQANAKEK